MTVNKEQRDFIEKFSVLGAKLGMPRSTARVLGLLLVCEPEEQSAATIQDQLRLSLGSVSSALSMLSMVGMVDQVSKSGERTMYYAVRASGIIRSAEQRIASFQEIADIAAQGQAIAPSNARLNTLHGVYTTLIDDFSGTLAKLKRLYPEQ